MGGVPADFACVDGVMMCNVWPGEKSQDFPDEMRSLPLPSALQMHFFSASCLARGLRRELKWVLDDCIARVYIYIYIRCQCFRGGCVFFGYFQL